MRINHLTKQSPNNDISFSGALIPKLLNKPFASCSFRNLYFLIPRTSHFDCIIILPFSVLKIIEPKVLVFSLHFTQ